MTALFSLARTGTARSGVSLIVAAHKGGRSVRRKIAIIDIFRRFRHRTALIPTNLPIHYRRICGLTIDSTIYPAVGPLGRSISQQDQPLMRLSLSETPYSWRTGASRVMLLPDGPTAQIALWRAHWTVPVQRAARSGDLGSSPGQQSAFRGQAPTAREWFNVLAPTEQCAPRTDVVRH